MYKVMRFLRSTKECVERERAGLEEGEFHLKIT